MSDPVPSKATCPVCDTPDGDHLDWCTPQAREQRPSKESDTPKTDAAVWYAEHDSMPTIPVVDADFARQMERELTTAHTALRGIQSCSTCEACRGAATRALGGAAPEPPVARCEHGNPIDPTGGYVCLKCFRAAQPPEGGQ